MKMCISSQVMDFFFNMVSVLVNDTNTVIFYCVQIFYWYSTGSYILHLIFYHVYDPVQVYKLYEDYYGDYQFIKYTAAIFCNT